METLIYIGSWFIIAIMIIILVRYELEQRRVMRIINEEDSQYWKQYQKEKIMKIIRSIKGYDVVLTFDQQEIFKYFNLEWMLFEHDIIENNKQLKNQSVNFFIRNNKTLWAEVPSNKTYYFYDQSVRQWYEEDLTEEG